MTRFRMMLKAQLVRGLFRAAGLLAPRATGRLLAARFLAPQIRGRRQALDAAHAARGATRGELRLHGTPIVTYQWGSPATEPYVLLSHGWSSFGLRLGSWVDGLRALGYAVVTFDQRAHGLSGGEHSSLPDFVSTYRVVTQHFGRPTAVVGHSMGAAVAVLGTVPSHEPGAFVLIAPLLDIERKARLFVRMMGAPRRVFAHFEDAVAAREKASFADLDVARRLPDTAGRLLVVHDELDRETPWDDGRRMTELWPGGQLMTTRGLGHNRVVDDTSVIDAALSFLGPAERTGAFAP